MTLCFMEQHLHQTLAQNTPDGEAHLGEMMQEIETLLGKIR